VNKAQQLSTMINRMIALLQRKGLRDALIVYGGYSFRFVSPLLLYPLLTRRLGAEMFGAYATSYSLALMLSVVVEYGFNLTGTRDIAVAPDAATRGRIASRIVFARLLLIPVALVIGGGLIAINPVLREYPSIAAIAVLLGCAQGSTAFWYFQGVRKVLVAVVLEIGGQILALLATVLLVRTAQDAELAIALQMAGFVICAILGITLMFREAPAARTGFVDAGSALRDGFPIFLSRSAVMIYTAASVFVLAALAGPLQAALYGAAERVTGAFTALLRPLSSVVLPRLSVEMSLDASQGFRSGFFVLVATTSFFLAIALALVAAAPYLAPLLFGSSFKAASHPLQWLAVSLPIVAMNTILGSQIMVALRLDSAIMRVLLMGGAVNLLLAFPLVAIWAAPGMAATRLMTELVILFGYGLTLRHLNQKGKVWPNNYNRMG
jgi:polysaccharide transporter, PST family